MTTKKPEPLLWLSDARGQYIPRDFAGSFVNRERDVTGVSADDWAILENPEHEYYWDTWSDVCDKARITDSTVTPPVTYTIYQNGDCWLIPEGMEYSEETDFFAWPAEE